ncbi:TetR/AcrR family transcriptional regulator [Nocardia sp. NPDC051030]|uniref:TetR/AcrR family transcriptional regulator n=1 Tax=Nocardia sp. NPDC051030 TaxID=3155162 RepID=UPI00344903E9
METSADLDRTSVASAEATTARVLAAARTTLLTYDSSAFTVRQVAKIAGVSEMTIYRRWPRKADLMVAVVLFEIERFVEQMESRVTSDMTVEEVVVEGFLTTYRYVQTNPVFVRLIAAESDKILPLLTAGVGGVFALLRPIIANRMRSAKDGHDYTADDLEGSAEVMLRICHSLWLTPDSHFALETDADLRAFARRSLVPLLRI